MTHDSVPHAILEIARRLLPGIDDPQVERTPSGGSTPVYRLRRSERTLYLRLAESATANLAPEALAHRLMRAQGAQVPEVAAFAAEEAAIGRSWMATSDIPGGPLAATQSASDMERVLRAAGRDLARIHTIPVAGFGWIRRDAASWQRLRGELPTLHAFSDELAAHLPAMQGVLTAAEMRALADHVAARDTLLPQGQARLVHGDFDLTHIFQRDGSYTGIIDFGEIRGADPLYDLGHFALHDGEFLSYRALPALLAGYDDVTPLPADALPRIRLWSLLIGVRALARQLDRPASAYRDHLLRTIRSILTGRETGVGSRGEGD